MDIIDLAVARHYGTAVEDWRLVGGAAVHKDCVVTEARFLGPAICRSGDFRGGDFRGGDFHGGDFHGGVFHGGVFRGGVFHGGVFRKTPLQLFGLCTYTVTIGRPGEVSVGCQCHTPAEWRKWIRALGRTHGADEAEQARVMVAVGLVAAWMVANPDAVEVA